MKNESYMRALKADRVDTKQSYGVVAIVYELQEFNKLKAQEVYEANIANRIEFLKILREEEKHYEYEELLNILGKEML